MTSRIGAASLCTLAVLAGCRLAARAETWPPPYLRQFPSPNGRIEVTLVASPIFPVGDTVPIGIGRRQCHGDVCAEFGDPSKPDAVWTVDRPEVVTLIRGRLVARRPGRVCVTAASGDTVLHRNLEVIPPVARFEWEPGLTRARVGDTIRVRAVARDSLGRAIRVIPASSVEGGIGSAPTQILSWEGPDGTVLVANGPGQLVVSATLGRRSAILRMVIDER